MVMVIGEDRYMDSSRPLQHTNELPTAPTTQQLLHCDILSSRHSLHHHVLLVAHSSLHWLAFLAKGDN